MTGIGTLLGTAAYMSPEPGEEEVDNWWMPLSLQPDKLKQLQTSLKRYLVENVDPEAGDLKAKLLLDFCVKEIGAVVYNQAIVDAQAYFQARVGDLDGACYQHEFTYWQHK